MVLYQYHNAICSRYYNTNRLRLLCQHIAPVWQAPTHLILLFMTSWYPWNHGFHGIYPFIKTQDRDLGWACFICWSRSGYADSISWCSVIACPDWVHMFRGWARMREAIEDHQGILVRISQFPIDATQPSLNLRSKSESSRIFIAFVGFFCKEKNKQQEVSNLNKEFTSVIFYTLGFTNK